MEEEKIEMNIESNEEKVEVNNQAKKFNLKGFDYKKYLPYAGIALAVIVIIILVLVLGGGPKKTVKKYVSGIDSQKSNKVIKSIDLIGSAAWSYYYDEDDFDEEDYKEFIEEYEEYADEMKDDLDDEVDDMIEALDESFDEISDDYKSYKIKVEDFKKVKKLGKDLYAVDVKISVKAKPEDKDDDEIDEAKIMTFIVYKNKVISGMGI